MRRKRRGPNVSNRLTSIEDKKQQNQIALWGLKVLLDLKGWKSLQQGRNDFTSDGEILVPIGLGHLEDKEMNKKQFIKILKKQRDKFENQPTGPNRHLNSNSKKIAKYIGLNETERQILVFTVILQEGKALREITDKLGELNAEEVVVVISTLLDLPIQDVRVALSKHGLLTRSGLLRLNRDTLWQIYNKLDILDGLGEALHEPDTTVESMLHHYFEVTGQASLTEKDYSHVRDHLVLIREHLRQASEHQTQGINILIYGPPGSGKTEFAKTAARILESKLYEVNIGDEEKPFDKPKRMRAFQLAQQVLARQKNALLLFDEIDSLLEENFSFFLRDDNSLNLKAWINKNLESNPVPAIWIANDIRFAESAFIRRFDIVFNLDHPPRSTRLKILTNSLQGLPVRPQWLERLADNKHIAPAVITRAANVIRSQGQQSSEETENKLELLLESTLIAMGYPREPIIKSQSQIVYHLGAVNPDHDLKGIVQGLRKQEEGRLCLYGPPGTGKTEFGHYLARQMDKPLLVKRSSDLLGPYVGETETNIANMFREANHEEAVLLLDEADSFLRDRSEANRSWEVTQVNELLTQMEQYNGVFVCSTNLIDSFDAASLRRFDLKIKFDFLKSKQAWNLFVSIFKEKDVRLTRKKYWQRELARYTALTPGDFATVVRKNRISGINLCPENLLEGLAKEMTFKQTGPERRIGFLA